MITLDRPSPTTSNNHQPGAARSVILLVGDGMGQAHRFAGQLAAVGLDGRLRMDRLPCFGLMSTTAADPRSFVTDSAAAATAMAVGVRTYNGAIGVGPDRQRRPTVLELAKWAGKSAGLVTTCQITDATPAAFGAHVIHRVDHSEIARQYLEDSNVDVILGGGGAYWLPADETPPMTDPNRHRGTAGNLVARARDLGYTHVADLDGLHAAIDQGVDRLLGLFAPQEFFSQRPEGHGDTYDPPVSLATMTEAALATLDQNPNGFFLLVEEAAIDRMAHRNNAPMVLRGVEELDKAVGVALAYAHDHPDTLIIVAADHETGGLAIAGPDDPAFPYERVQAAQETAEFAGEDGPFPVAGSDHLFIMGWTTTGHTAAAVPVTATGPGAERLAGNFANTHLFDVMVAALGLAARVR